MDKCGLWCCELDAFRSEIIPRSGNLTCGWDFFWNTNTFVNEKEINWSCCFYPHLSQSVRYLTPQFGFITKFKKLFVAIFRAKGLFTPSESSNAGMARLIIPTPFTPSAHVIIEIDPKHIPSGNADARCEYNFEDVASRQASSHFFISKVLTIDHIDCHWLLAPLK